MQKIFVGPDNKIVIKCPVCGKEKGVDLTKYFSIAGPAKLTYRFTCDNCDCGHVDCEICLQDQCDLDHSNTVQLERRRSPRKNTNINGKLQIGKSRPGDVSIIDISLHGVKIQLPPMFEIFTGAAGVLSFSQDDKAGTTLSKEGKVLRVVNNTAVFLFDE